MNTDSFLRNTEVKIFEPVRRASLEQGTSLPGATSCLFVVALDFHIERGFMSKDLLPVSNTCKFCLV